MAFTKNDKIESGGEALKAYHQAQQQMILRRKALEQALQDIRDEIHQLSTLESEMLAALDKTNTVSDEDNHDQKSDTKKSSVARKRKTNSSKTGSVESIDNKATETISIDEDIELVGSDCNSSCSSDSSVDEFTDGLVDSTDVESIQF
mgnify:FL=1|jgi:hypothetical protein